MSCYIVQEGDGSRFTLEDDSGFLLLEFCPPDGGEYNPVGGPPVFLMDRKRRRRREEKEIISIVLGEL